MGGIRVQSTTPRQHSAARHSWNPCFPGADATPRHSQSRRQATHREARRRGQARRPRRRRRRWSQPPPWAPRPGHYNTNRPPGDRPRGRLRAREVFPKGRPHCWSWLGLGQACRPPAAAAGAWLGMGPVWHPAPAQHCEATALSSGVSHPGMRHPSSSRAESEPPTEGAMCCCPCTPLRNAVT